MGKMFKKGKGCQPTPANSRDRKQGKNLDQAIEHYQREDYRQNLVCVVLWRERVKKTVEGPIQTTASLSLTLWEG